MNNRSVSLYTRIAMCRRVGASLYVLCGGFECLCWDDINAFDYHNRTMNNGKLALFCSYHIYVGNLGLYL